MSEDSLLVAIDASTTSVRATVFDLTGHPVASGRAGLGYQRIDRDGYEQDARSWWSTLVTAVRSALAELPPERLRDLTALTVAHQRETIVLTDARGEPLGPALLWMDSRCTEDVREAERTIGSVRLHALTGKPACTTPSLYKLMYLLRSRPELRDVAHVHDVHSFLARKLTGRAVSSFASADPTGLVDLRKKAWATPLTHLIGVEPHQLPELVEVGYLIGPLSAGAAAETGLPEHVLVYAGTGDGQAAGLGAGVIDKGRAFVDLGTAVSSGVITDRYQVDQAFRTLHAAIPGKYCLETNLLGGMLTLWWLIDTMLGSADRAASRTELERQAASISAGSDGLLALPYWAGAMNPFWDDVARGAFLGLHPGHQPAHLYRSILEGIALEQRLHLEGVESALGQATEELVVLGGGSRSDLWCQILADALGRTVLRCRTPEAASLGAAILGAVAHGLFPSFDHAVADMTHLGERFVPGDDAAIYERIYRDAYKGLYPAIVSRMSALSEVRALTNPQGLPSVFPPAK